MLRDVVVHILNEQPILADLIQDPAPSDVALICTNMRTMNGKKPVFIDAVDSTFLLPLAHIRFIEIHKASTDAHAAETNAENAGKARGLLAAGARADAEEEDLGGGALARLGWLAGEAPDPEPKTETEAAGPAPAPKNPDDIDPDLLRRIREA
jgi:hypothetical protein